MQQHDLELAMMKNRLTLKPIVLALSSTLLFTGCLTDNAVEKRATTVTGIQSIKSPSAMRADIVLEGRVSTLNHIDIQHIGKQVPYTYSEGKIGNSRGYDWWVSKHFALKSDLPEQQVRLYLELLELSYPHYVELFGKEPPNIENQRIAVVYGSSRARVKEAMLDDGFLRGVHDTAGGETMYYNRAGYNFPSHRYHHQRYIVIHETMHAFHMALTGHSSWAPNWITEGLADSIAHHVYDPDKKQLNVMVFDRAPMNYLITGLNQYFAANKPTIEQINDDPALKRGLNFFIIHFLLNDPKRALYFRHFMERLMAANPHSDSTLPVANRLLKETFPDWALLEKEFAEFVAKIKPTFNIVEGPWEQNGEYYWVRNTDSEEFARLDVTPSMQVPMPVMDFKHHNLDKLNQAGASIRLTPEQAQRGKVGFAFILELDDSTKAYRKQYQGKQPQNKDSMLSFLIADGKTLEMHLPDGQTKHLALNENISNRLAASDAVNIVFEQASSPRLLIQSGDEQMNIPVELDDPIQNKINLTSIALLSQQSNHLVAPLLNVRRNETNKLGSTNPWGITNWDLLYQAFATCEDYSAFLLECKNKLSSVLSAVNQADIDKQIDDLAMTFFEELTELAKSQEAPIGQLNSALSQLAGLKTNVEFDHKKPYLQVDYNFIDTALNGKVTYKNEVGTALKQSTITGLISNGRTRFTLDMPENTSDIAIDTRLLIKDQAVFAKRQAKATPFDGVWLSVIPTINSHVASLNVTLSGPYSGPTNGQLAVEYLSTEALTAAPKQTRSIDINPYEEKSWEFDVNLPNKRSQRDIIRIQAQLEVDGEPVKLTKQFTLLELM